MHFVLAKPSALDILVGMTTNTDQITMKQNMNTAEIKTIRQHFEGLPEDLRRKAFRAADQRMLTERVETPAKAIQKGIRAAYSVEGYAFWNAIYSEYSEI